MSWSELVLLVPMAIGLVYACATVVAARAVVRHDPAPSGAREAWPAITILKPVYGLERDLEQNLRSALQLDYPEYQVVLSVQRLDDPALPLLESLAEEFDDERVVLAVSDSVPVVNGKVQNLIGALAHARHDIVLISDSDVRLEPDYLKRMAAPFADTRVGAVCTYYRGVGAETWFERLEQLSINGEFVVNVMFAQAVGNEEFCPGCSLAIRREVLDQAGGFEPLLEYLVEDYEIGRRIRAAGYRLAVVPCFVDTMVDLERPGDWWHHQVYWEQNTRWVNPLGFVLTIFVQPMPFAVVFAMVRGFDPTGWVALALVIAVRIVTRAAIFRHTGDRATSGMLGLLPLRDLTGFAAWAAALTRRSFVWRGLTFDLRRGGRIVPRGS